MAKDKAIEDDDEKKTGKDGEPEGGAPEAESAAKTSTKTKIILIIAGAVLVFCAVGGGTFFFLGKKEAKTTEQLNAASTADQKAKTVYFSLGDLLVNLSGEGKHPNFLKVKISLELADEKDLPLMEAIKPRIVDNFQVYLRELRIEDLRGSAGMYRLREELLMRVTEAAQPVRVRDVLFQEMLVQ